MKDGDMLAAVKLRKTTRDDLGVTGGAGEDRPAHKSTSVTHVRQKNYSAAAAAGRASLNIASTG
jgi:hypothetical protein